MFLFVFRWAHRVCANVMVLRGAVCSVLAGSLLLLAGCGASTPQAASSSASSTGSGAGSPITSSAGLNISSSLPAGSVGTSYSATVAVTGGTAPYTFTLASGELPEGLGLSSSSGKISGTPGATGNANFAIAVSDAQGESKQQALQITVNNAQTSNPSSPPANATANQGNSFSSVQRSGGWQASGQRGPNYVDCSPSPCDGISFWMGQGISSPSLSGDAAGFSLGGSVPFSDAIFVNHLIGPDSTEGLPDNNQTLVPSLHDFTYDVYFYGSFNDSQALEFDINQFFNNMGFIWGHECRIDSGNEWDVWDNQNARWTPTGIPCYPNNNSWNHLTIKVQRNSNDELMYQSITLNGQTGTLNWTFPHGSSPGWYGLTINYQMDGDAHQDSYTVYLDNLTFWYE